jgi:hypothetical protein
MKKAFNFVLLSAYSVYVLAVIAALHSHLRSFSSFFRLAVNTAFTFRVFFSGQHRF